jgi:hypothetical protein
MTQEGRTQNCGVRADRIVSRRLSVQQPDASASRRRKSDAKLRCMGVVSWTEAGVAEMRRFVPIGNSNSNDNGLRPLNCDRSCSCSRTYKKNRRPACETRPICARVRSFARAKRLRAQSALRQRYSTMPARTPFRRAASRPLTKTGSARPVCECDTHGVNSFPRTPEISAVVHDGERQQLAVARGDVA